MIAVLIIGVIVFFGLLNASRDTAAVLSAGDDGDDGDDDFLFNDDIYYSPIYAHMPCNIHYDSSQDFLSSDDDWPSSSIDDDFMSSSDTAFDDDLCSCSSFDDDGIGCGCGCGCGMWDD